jgi:hypothetical protein
LPNSGAGDDILHSNTCTNKVEDDASAHPARVFGHIRAREAVDLIRIIQIIRIDRARAAIEELR